MKVLETPNDMAIGALADRSGVNVPTIRYYEEIGLIPPAQRRPSGHRVYGPDELELLSFIRSCRDFGFSIDQVRALVALSKDTDRDCDQAREEAQTHLDAVRIKLAELRTLEHSLAKFIKSCALTCAGGPAPECTILKDLGQTAVLAGPAPGSVPADRVRDPVQSDVRGT